MVKTLVSVIIPCYNAEKYLVDCLDSVLQQDWPHLEVICINDGSTDNTLFLLNEMKKKDSRVIVYSQENKGAAKARDLGVKISKGEYIMFLDSDDTLIESALSLMMNVALDKDKPDIIVSGFNIVQGGSERKGRMMNLHSLNRLSYLKGGLTGVCTCHLCSKFFKRKLFTAREMYIPNLRIAEDAVVLIQLICVSQLIKSCPVPIYNYNQNQTSATHTKSVEYVEDTLRAGCLVQEYLKKYDFYESIKDYVSAFYLLLYSTSTRRGYLNRQNKYVKAILTDHLRLKSLKLIPFKKAVYVFFLLKLHADLLLKFIYKQG